MKKVVIVFMLLPFMLFSQQNSVFNSGIWFKIAVNGSGVHKITYAELQDNGFDISGVDPLKMCMYGNPNGMLPEDIGEDYYTDVQQIAIEIVGEEDGVFDPEDYILFYGQSSDRINFNYQSNHFDYIKNIYSLETYYFLTIGEQNGKRIGQQQSTELDHTGVPGYYDLLLHHELELVNSLKSGKQWLGEQFSGNQTRTFSFDTPNPLASDDNNLHISLAANSSEQCSFDINIDGLHYKTILIHRIPNTYVSSNLTILDSVFNTTGNGLDISVVFNPPNDSAIGWLDFIDLELNKSANLNGLDQINYRSKNNIGSADVSKFLFFDDSPESLKIWNTTDPVNVSDVELLYSTEYAWYKLETPEMLEFTAFNGNSFLSVVSIEQIDNQNLHGQEPVDFIIVTHNDFIAQANELAEFHNSEEGFSAKTITIDQVYNEFSSGSQDISAIRNFVRYMSDKTQGNYPKYLLLFGDASFDYLNRNNSITNYIPTFETLNSSNYVSSYASDQFFGVVDANQEHIISVGRIPITTSEEAQSVVNKIKSYNSASNQDNWYNEIMVIADDGDQNVHIKHEERICELFIENRPEWNVLKAYSDFYETVQTNNGPRCPEVTTLINEKVNDGVFIVNYAGHGGPSALANEQIVTNEEILTWQNGDKLPIWIISSSDVSRYDDPDIHSLGELLVTSDDKGAIATISTSRPTFASSNLVYNLALTEKLTNANQTTRLGDIFANPSVTNNDKKWVLLGDPALIIHKPEYEIQTMKINDVSIDVYTDTISPGDHVLISGNITDYETGNIQQSFNGTLSLKVFAPVYIKTTLSNQGGSQVENVEVQDSVLVIANTIVET